MIRQLIGVLVTLCVLAVVVLTVLHHDRYVSMLHFGDPDVTLPAPDTLPAAVPAGQADTAGVAAVGAASESGAAFAAGEEADSLTVSSGMPAAARDSLESRSVDPESRGGLSIDEKAAAAAPVDTVNRRNRPNAPRS